MKKLKLEQSVKQAIESIKNGPYQGTYIKVELEGHLRRYWGEWPDGRCHDFMLEQLKASRHRIVYSDFVEDGSVDSEFTFTVSLDHTYVIVQAIRAFKELAKATGNELQTGNAGMHITILNSPNGMYPADNLPLNYDYWTNLRTEVTRLLPALYLLASANHRSRPLYFRNAIVSGSHYAAVSLTGEDNVIEWRVFETCYQRPEMFYDFLCTVARGLEFYSDKKAVIKSKIGSLDFPDVEGRGIHRFYYTERHLEALKEGMAHLVPAHRTIDEALKLRNFGVTDKSIHRKRQRLVETIETDWEIEQERLRLQVHERILEARAYALRRGQPFTRIDAKRLEIELRQNIDKGQFIRQRLRRSLVGSLREPARTIEVTEV